MDPQQRAVPPARRESDAATSGWSCLPCGGSNPPGTKFCGHCGVPTTHATVVDEHRLITALFADISGFTTLADSLDTAALHRVISPVIGVLTGVAERYEGTIAKYAGDAVLVFFGAPVAVEDHAERALSCALDMHRELAAALPRLPAEAANLKLHVGVNTGRVIAGMFGGDLRADYSILGDAVNVAQRLESVAPPGETYVGELTQQLTATGFEFEDLGGLTLKGKPEPVPAWRLVRDARGATRALTRATSFVGRRDELRALTSAVKQVIAGRGALATVVAEPGSGKSRLLEELRTYVDSRDAGWLEARSISYGASVPYWPFVDLLRRTFGISLDLDPEDAAARLRSAFATQSPRAAHLVARLLGVPLANVDEQVELLSPEAFNRELADTLVEWVSAQALGAPTVLVVEDVHWVDSASAELLARIVRLLDASRLLLVLSGRPEGEPFMDRMAAIAPTGRAVDLRLEALDEAATAAMISDVLGAPASAEAVTAVCERTGGNPFFIQELVRALRESSALVLDGAEWQLDTEAAAAVPLTVEGVISARIDRLPQPAAQVLLAAAVVGRRVDLALLDGVTELDGHLPRMVDALVEAGLLDRAVIDATEIVRFHHALVVDVAYGRLVDRQRRQLHRRVAETAEVLYGSGDDVIDLLARHFYLADAGVKAADHLERAAARAKRLYANDQAIAHLRCAIELARRTEKLTSRLPRLLLEAADVELLSSCYDDAARDFAEARDLTGDVRAWCGLSAVHRKWARFDDAVSVVDEARASREFVAEDAARLWLERSAALAVSGDMHGAIESANNGLAALPSQDSAVAAELLLRLARAETVLHALDDALIHATNAQMILEGLGDRTRLALALRIVGDLLRETGRLAEACSTLEAGLATAEQTGNAEELGGCLINLGLAYLQAGRVEEAIACDERALALFTRAGNLNGQATVEANLGEKLLVQGRLDEAFRRCEIALTIATATRATVVCADARRTVAGVLAARGDVEHAHAVAAESAELFASMGDHVNAADALAIVDRFAVRELT